MRLRAVGIGALCVFGMTTVAAATPPRVSCHAVTDPRDDLSQDVISQTRPGTPSGALDLVGGDIAADARTITAVVNLAGQAQADAYSPMGYAYRFRFTVNTADNPQTFEMSALIGQASQLYDLSRVENGSSSGLGVYIRGAVDQRSHGLRMSADVSQLQQLAAGQLPHPVGHDFSELTITSGTVTGDPAIATFSADGDDVAYAHVKVRIGAPSCVRQGA